MSRDRSLGHRRPAPRPRPEVIPEHERGLSLLMVALIITPLLIITALVADVGVAKQRRRQIQSGADAAALAAAQELDGSSGQIGRAVATAKTWAAKNVDGLTAADWAGCTDPAALAHRPDTGNACISFDSSTTPTKVRVRIPVEDQPQFFGRLVRPGALQVSASAVASRTGGTPAQTAGPCGLCVIGDRSLQIAGSTAIQVTGGEIQANHLTANSNDSNTSIGPVPLRWFNSNNSNWGRNVQPSPQTFNARYSQLSAPVPNPFATTTVSYAGLTVDSTTNINAPTNTIQPDRIYRQSVNVNGNVTLAPNRTYYFGGNLQVNSGARLTGSGVTLVFTCASLCNGAEGGKFNFASGSTVSITAPTSGTYAGFAILFDPTMTSGTPNQLSGTITLDGAVYGKGVGFNMGSGSGIVKAWTVVAGGQFDANQGRLEIDNTKFYGGSGGGSGAAGGTIALVG